MYKQRVDLLLPLAFVFTCVVSVSCTKGQLLSMTGQQLCQQDMGPIMKNLKASVQVSKSSVMFRPSVNSEVCGYSVLANSVCLFCYLHYFISSLSMLS